LDWTRVQSVFNYCASYSNHILQLGCCRYQNRFSNKVAPLLKLEFDVCEKIIFVTDGHVRRPCLKAEKAAKALV
jgi:hypothetical protein